MGHRPQACGLKLEQAQPCKTLIVHLRPRAVTASVPVGDELCSVQAWGPDVCCRAAACFSKLAAAADVTQGHVGCGIWWWVGGLDIIQLCSVASCVLMHVHTAEAQPGLCVSLLGPCW